MSRVSGGRIPTDEITKAKDLQEVGPYCILLEGRSRNEGQGILKKTHGNSKNEISLSTIKMQMILRVGGNAKTYFPQYVAMDTTTGRELVGDHNRD